VKAKSPHYQFPQKSVWWESSCFMWTGGCTYIRKLIQGEPFPA